MPEFEELELGPASGSSLLLSVMVLLAALLPPAEEPLVVPKLLAVPELADVTVLLEVRELLLLPAPASVTVEVPASVLVPPSAVVEKLPLQPTEEKRKSVTVRSLRMCMTLTPGVCGDVGAARGQRMTVKWSGRLCKRPPGKPPRGTCMTPRGPGEVGDPARPMPVAVHRALWVRWTQSGGLNRGHEGQMAPIDWGWMGLAGPKWCNPLRLEGVDVAWPPADAAIAVRDSGLPLDASVPDWSVPDASAAPRTAAIPVADSAMSATSRDRD